jgi:hypothetical protein
VAEWACLACFFVVFDAVGIRFVLLFPDLVTTAIVPCVFALFLKYAPGAGSPCLLKALAGSAAFALLSDVVRQNAAIASAPNPNLNMIFIQC